MNTKNDCHNQKWCSSNTPPQHQAQFHFFSAPLSQLAYKFPTKKKEFSGSERSFSDHFLLICFTLGAVQLALIDGIRVRGSPLILLRHSGVASNYISVVFFFSFHLHWFWVNASTFQIDHFHRARTLFFFWWVPPPGCPSGGLCLQWWSWWWDWAFRFEWSFV